MFCMCFKKKCSIDILVLSYCFAEIDSLRLDYMDMNTRQKTKHDSFIWKIWQQTHQQHVLKAQWKIFDATHKKLRSSFSQIRVRDNQYMPIVSSRMNQHTVHKTSQIVLKELSPFSVFFSMTLSYILFFHTS